MAASRFPALGFNGTYNDGTTDRLIIDTTKVWLYSPDGLKWSQLANSSWRYNDGNGWRMVANSTEFSFKSPNLTNELIVSDDDVRLKYGASKLLLSGSGLFHDGQRVQTAAHKGAADGIAELVNGIVPTSQLPAYVSAIVEYASHAALVTADPQETDKLYIALDDSKLYRWTGSAGSYAEISPTVVLGTTSATAYRGDHGLVAYEHSQLTPEHIDWTGTTEDLSTEGKVSTTGGGETGRFLTGLAGSTVFSFTGSSFDIRAGNGSSSSQNVLSVTPTTLIHNDGTFNRLGITDTTTILVSPDGANNVQVSNTGLLYNDVQVAMVDDLHSETLLVSGDDTLTITDTSLIHNDGLVDRSIISQVESVFYGPFSINFLRLTAAAVYYNDVEIATVDDLHNEYTHPAGDGNLHVPATSTTNNGKVLTAGTTVGSLTWEDASGHDADKIVSPDGLKSLTLTNTSFVYNDGTYERININESRTLIASPDLTKQFFADADEVSMTFDGERRVEADDTTTSLRSPDGSFKLTITDSEVQFKDATSVRFRLTSSASYLESPNSQNYISINNTQMYTIGYSKLGSGAPSIKMKKLTGTSPSTQGGVVQITHGLNAAKILSWSVIVTKSTTRIAPNYVGAVNYEYDTYLSANTIVLINSGANSGNMLSRAVSILITYEV